jgi:hypothetical protein
MMLDLFYHQFRQGVDKVGDPGLLRSCAVRSSYIWLPQRIIRRWAHGAVTEANREVWNVISPGREPFFHMRNHISRSRLSAADLHGYLDLGPTAEWR